MLEFLSDEWLTALDEAVRDADLSRDAASPLVIQQVVIDGDEPDARAYHIDLLAGHVRVRAGRANDPTISFTTDRRTAAAIASGSESAQTAFIQGRLRVGGDTRALLDHADELERLDGLFAPVRSATVY